MGEFGPWTLEQLTVTSYSKYRPTNIPEAEARKNLIEFSKGTLEPLYKYVGPFTFDSVYRSHELNQAVGGSPNSFHRIGKAADLVPEMGAYEFAATIEKSPSLRNLVGEIIVNSPRVVHISAPIKDKIIPLQQRTPAGKYARFSTEELKEFLSKYGKEVTIGLSSTFLLVAGALYFSQK